jgi:hypothetical protein
MLLPHFKGLYVMSVFYWSERSERTKQWPTFETASKSMFFTPSFKSNCNYLLSLIFVSILNIIQGTWTGEKKTDE